MKKTAEISLNTDCKKKDERFEYIRAIAIVAVVAIHTINSAIVLFGENASDLFGVYIYRSVMNLMWFSVPCFLMLTGLLLLSPEKKIDVKTLYKKYIFKIAVVLLVFGVAYSWMELVFSQKSIHIHQIFESFINVIQGETWAHLWYLYCLLGIYFLLPVWSLVSKHSSDSEYRYIVLILFIFASALKCLRLFGIDIGLYNHIANIYPFWILFGAGYHRKFFDISKKKAISLIFINSALLLTGTIFEVYACFNGINWSGLFGYDSVLVIGQAIGLFALCLKFTPPKWLGKLMLELANKSFGIYLVHMVFINLEYKLFDLNPFEQGLFIGLILILVNIIISYCVVWILKKIPFVCRFI